MPLCAFLPQSVLPPWSNSLRSACASGGGLFAVRIATSGAMEPKNRRPTLKEVKARRARTRRFFLIKASVPILVGFLLVRAYLVRQRRSRSASAKSKWAPVYGIFAKRDFPHDLQAFTQGLLWFDGFLYESTGLRGHSSLRQIDSESGEVLDIKMNGNHEFAEGVALGDANGNELIQMLWKVGKGHVWTRDGLVRKSTFGIEGDAWGIATGTRGLYYMSDGSSRIRVYRREGDGLELVRAFTVRDGGKDVHLLNELEVIDGELWANIWFADLIARIDPDTGIVRSWVYCGGLLKKEYVPEGHRTDVLNGIAYDSKQKRIFVTGKLWPRIFEIEVTQGLFASSVRYLKPFFMDEKKVRKIMQSTK